MSKLVLGDGRRWDLQYDLDGLLNASSDTQSEWGKGGVPLKFGNIAYATDANGWTTTKGALSCFVLELNLLIQDT